MPTSRNVPPTPGTPAPNPTDWVVVVAVSDSAGPVDYIGPVEDARLFRGWLTDPFGGGLLPGRVKFILTECHDGRSVRRNALAALSWLDGLALDGNRAESGPRAGR